jgi:hypothetical protein
MRDEKLMEAIFEVVAADAASVAVIDSEEL